MARISTSIRLLALTVALAHNVRGTSDGLPRGWHTAPYVRYEAEQGSHGGGALDRTAFDFDPGNTAVEASGQHHVGLPVTGAFLQWNVTNAGAGLTLRFTLPDSAGGAGVAGSLDIYVNGTNTTTINLGSYWAWTYFVSSNPQNTPGVRPRMRFDELHFGLPAPLQPGDVLRIQKNNADALEYGIDFVEIEAVPPPLTQPPGYLSVTSYGANGGDSAPDSAAFQAAWQAAIAAGTGLYLPPGRYVLTNKLNLGVSGNLRLQGAGIWYTELHFANKTVGGGGIYVNEGTHGLEISHFFMSSVLNERYIVPGVISDYKAFNGTFGSGSSLHNLWITHFETGAWLADETAPVNLSSNFVFASNRVRNTYADGINFSQGTRNSTVRHCSFRDNGDDALAVWPTSRAGAPEGRDNTFHNNTIEFTYRAGGIGIFGGSGHRIHHNLIRDGTDSSGIRFTEDFSGYHFQNNSGIYVYENTLVGRGTSLDLWNLPRGAIEISGAGIRNIFFDHTTIQRSPRHAIQLRGGTNLYFSNTTIQVTGLDRQASPGGAAVRQYDLPGGARFAHLLMSDIEHNPPVIQEVPGYALDVDSEFPFTEFSTVVVPEGGVATLGVRLSFTPAGVVTVTTSRLSGDTNLVLSGGSTFLFTAANALLFQPLHFTATEDGDVSDGTALFLCQAPGYGETTVTAVEFDNDVNHPPLAADDTATTDENQPVTLALLANDSDPDAHTLTLATVSTASHGLVAHNGATATYTPTLGFHGSDAFIYVVHDGNGGLATGHVAITVLEVITPNPYRMAIEFPGFLRDEHLSNFPVLVRFAPDRAGFAYGQFASPAGHDLRFADGTGAVLNYEVETWNTQGTSFVWVQVPHFTNGCRIEASWGSPDNASQADYTTNGATWSAGYAAVFHAGDMDTVRRDSTPGNRHGKTFGNTTSSTGVAGGADAFDGNGDYVELPSTFALFNGLVGLTVEFYFKANTLPATGDWQTSPVLFQGNGESAWMVTLGDSIPANAIGNRVDQGGWTTPVYRVGITTGQWYHYASTYSAGGTNNWRMHLDGTHVTQATRSGLIGFLTEKNAYGGNYVGTDRWFDGLMDEIRISTVARSSNWIWASRLTTISNESFTAYGGVSGNVPALIAAETVLVDFGNDASYRGASVVNPDSNGNAWNSVWSGAYYPALLDISNHTTAIGLGFDSAPGTDSYNGPAGVIVAGALGALGGATNAVNDYYVNASFQLQGLNTGRTYRFTFFGSHAYSDDDATVYSVYTGGFHTGLVGSVSLNVQQPGAPDRHNSNSVAVLSGLVPAANGSFYVSFIGNQGHNGYLNALMLESFNPALDYDRWSLNYPGLGPRLADDDGDGVANLLEFGFGGNPTQASDRGFSGNLHIGLHAGEPLLMHTYRRRSAEAGLSYRAEWSTNLLNATWLTNGLQQQPAAPLGDGFEAVTNSLPLLDPQRYLRIVLEEP